MLAEGIVQQRKASAGCCLYCNVLGKPAKKQERKYTPFGVNLMRSQVLYQAAQGANLLLVCNHCNHSSCSAHSANSANLSLSNLPRCLRTNIFGAVQAKALDQEALATINAYNPGLSAAWMFQRAMSVRPNHSSNPNFINRLLGVNFRSMHTRGDWVLKPFMQVIQACFS